MQYLSRDRCQYSGPANVSEDCSPIDEPEPEDAERATSILPTRTGLSTVNIGGRGRSMAPNNNWGLNTTGAIVLCSAYRCDLGAVHGVPTDLRRYDRIYLEQGGGVVRWCRWRDGEVVGEGEGRSSSTGVTFVQRVDMVEGGDKIRWTIGLESLMRVYFLLVCRRLPFCFARFKPRLPRAVLC